MGRAARSFLRSRGDQPRSSGPKAVSPKLQQAGPRSRGPACMSLTFAKWVGTTPQPASIYGTDPGEVTNDGTRLDGSRTGSVRQQPRPVREPGEPARPWPEQRYRRSNHRSSSKHCSSCSSSSWNGSCCGSSWNGSSSSGSSCCGNYHSCNRSCSNHGRRRLACRHRSGRYRQPRRRSRPRTTTHDSC